MQLAYKRDLNHNYVYVEGGQGEDYQSRMVMENKIEGLLSCSSECLDGKRIFRYEITSMQSLWTLYEDKKYDHAELESYYLQVLDTAERLRQYLLDPAALVLSPKLIYLDGQSGKLYFCFLPGHSEEITLGLRKLSEYFLPKIDHADEEAVALGYGIYHVLMEDGAPMEQLRREIMGGTKNKPGTAIDQPADAETKEEQMDEKTDPNTAANARSSWDGEKREKKKSVWDGEKREKKKSAWDGEKREKKSAGDAEKWEKKKSAGDSEAGANLRIVLGGGAVFAALLLLGRSALADKYGMPVIIGGILVITGIVGALAYALQLRKKDREEKQATYMQDGHKPKKSMPEEQKEYMAKEYKPKEYMTKKQKPKKYMAKEQKPKEYIPKEHKPKEYIPKEHEPEEYMTKNYKPGAYMPEEQMKGEGKYAEDEFTTVLKREQESGSPILYPVNADDLSPIRIDRKVLLLGKLKEMSDAVIPRPTVSRIHAKIRCEDGRWYLGDLNSKNGTYVNGRLLKADEMCCLGEGDEVAFADVRYQFNADIRI